MNHGAAHARARLEQRLLTAKTDTERRLIADKLRELDREPRPAAAREQR